MAFRYYPHGFRVGDPKVPYDEYLLADCEVMELWTEIHRPGFDCNDIAFIRRSLTALKRLVPSVEKFYADQIGNHHVYGANYQYLYELAEYIKFGKPMMSMAALLPILNEGRPYPVHDRKVTMERDSFLSSAREARRIALKTSTSETPEFELMLSHSGGIKQIVCTMYVLFGSNLNNC